MPDATALLRLYASHRMRTLARRPPAEMQERQLLALLRRAAGTRFGREHGFAAIRDVAGFRDRVPLRRYEDFWTGYWQAAFPHLGGVSWPGAIPFLAATSGTTTGVTKYIPVSRAMLRSNTRAAFEVFVHHLAHRPASRVFGGRNFMLGGSTALVEQAPGVLSGDLSGIARRAVPRWLGGLAFPPEELALMSDWERKVEALIDASLAADIRSIAGTASWLLLFLERLAARHPDRPARLASFYPNLDLVVHGGVDFRPYRRRYEAWLEGGHAELREVYAASEGFLAVADRGSGEGLRLILDTGIFYEFVPVEELGAARPVRHWVAEIETGVNYAVVMSTCAGLWAYVLGDTVRFVDRDPPRLLITGRTAQTLSAFGEHLIVEEIERAVSGAADALGLTVTDYSVGAVHPEETAGPERPGPGGHLFVVEFADGVPGPATLARFGSLVDEGLAALNADYRDHRAGGFGMAPPQVEPLPPGSFAAWMRARGKLGGQNKVPRILNDPALLESLRRVRPSGR